MPTQCPEKANAISRRKRDRRYLRKLKARAIGIAGAVCAKCGAKRNLHFAHIQATGLQGRGRGASRRYRDVIKRPFAYIRLCADCHWEYDHPLTDTDITADEIPY